jgi:hypothetical protein
MWILRLNDMRSSNVEILSPAARASTKEDLVAFLKTEKVEGYRDGQWGKGFRAGGPLEWFNQPFLPHDEHLHFVDVDRWRSAELAAIDATIARLQSLPEAP